EGAMKAFQMAASRQAEADEATEEPIDLYTLEFTIGDYEFAAKPPTPSQVALLIGTSNLGSSAALGAAFRFLRGTLDRRSYNLLLTLLESGEIEQDLLLGGNEQNEGGIVDWLIEQVADRPTQAPTG